MERKGLSAENRLREQKNESIIKNNKQAESRYYNNQLMHFIRQP